MTTDRVDLEAVRQMADALTVDWCDAPSGPSCGGHCPPCRASDMLRALADEVERLEHVCGASGRLLYEASHDREMWRREVKRLRSPEHEREVVKAFARWWAGPESAMDENAAHWPGTGGDA